MFSRYRIPQTLQPLTHVVMNVWDCAVNDLKNSKAFYELTQTFSLGDLVVIAGAIGQEKATFARVFLERQADLCSDRVILFAPSSAEAARKNHAVIHSYQDVKSLAAFALDEIVQRKCTFALIEGLSACRELNGEAESWQEALHMLKRLALIAQTVLLVDLRRPSAHEEVERNAVGDLENIDDASEVDHILLLTASKPATIKFYSYSKIIR